MKFQFFIFLLILLTPFAFAEGFSPSSLVYLMQPNEELCQVVSLDSDSVSITVSDSWAENKDVDWQIGLFNTAASEHGLSIDYDEELTIDEREIPVCISGSKLGEYHGAIIFAQAKEGTSIVRFDVWLKVVIEEQPAETQQQTSSGGSSSGGGGGGGSAVKAVAKNATNSTDAKDVEYLAGSTDMTAATTGGADITSDTIQENVEKSGLSPILKIIPIIFIAAVFVGAILVRKKRRALTFNQQQFQV